MIPIPVNHYGTTVQTPTSGSYSALWIGDLYAYTGSLKILVNNNFQVNTTTLQSGYISCSIGDVIRVELTGSGVNYPFIKVSTGPQSIFGPTTIVARLCNKPSGPLSGSVTFTVPYIPFPVGIGDPPPYPPIRAFNIEVYLNQPCS